MIGISSLSTYHDRPVSVYLKAVMISLLFLVVFVAFHDTDGFEGDDINNVVPILNFESAIKGDIEIYRYEWQPLTYQLARFVYELSGDVDLIFLIPSVSMALAIFILYLIIGRYYRQSMLGFFVIVMAMPEIVYTALYYNSTAPAYALSALALLLLHYSAETEAKSVIYRGIGAGILLGLACLMRLDFVQTIPMFAYLALVRSGKWSLPIAFAAGGFIVLVLSILSGLLNIPAILDTYLTASDEIVDMSSTNEGWNLRFKLMVATATLSPIGFLLAFIGLALLFTKRSRAEQKKYLFALVFSLPMLYGITVILTVKYLMPFYLFLPLFFARTFEWMQHEMGQDRYRQVKIFLALLTFGLLFMAPQVSKESPYFSITLDQHRVIGTHDGDRSWGGYLDQIAKLKYLSIVSMDTRDAESQRIVDRVLDGAYADYVFVGEQNVFSDGGVGWRDARLKFERLGFPGDVVGQDLVRIDVRDARFWLTTDLNNMPADLLSRDTTAVIYPESDGS